MYKKTTKKILIVVFVFILLVAVAILAILHTKKIDDKDISELGIRSRISNRTYIHVKLIEEDDRESFYYYNKYNFEQPIKIPMKLLTFEIKEMFIHDSFKIYTNGPIHKKGETIQIAFDLSLYEIVSEYDEFIIEDFFMLDYLYIGKGDEVLRNVYLLLPIQNPENTTKLDSVLLTVKDNKLHIQDFIDQGLLDYHILFKGNELVKDDEYKVQDGLTIEGLKQYFDIIVNRK